MLIDAIWDWNPWWNSPKTIVGLTGIERDDLKRLILAIDDPKVIIISGVRRSGKTTLMYQMISYLLERGVQPANILFLGLEDPAFSNIGLDDLIREYRKEHVPNGRIYLFLDEIQSKEGWERIVRKESDTRKETKFTVSGSSSSLLAGRYATLLTGRNLTYTIKPLPFREFIKFYDTHHHGPSLKGQAAERTAGLFNKYLDIGGFPEVVLQPEARRKITLNQYFSDIIHRDIVHLHSADARKVHTLASYLLLSIGKDTSLSSLRKAVGLSYDAIRDYLKYMEEAGLFYLIKEFSFSPKPGPTDHGKMKVYCSDLGLAKASYGRHSREQGRFAENAVLLELISRGLRPGFFKGRNEVDFVNIDENGMVLLMNVCIGQEIPDRELKGPHEFIERYPKVKVESLLLTDHIEGDFNGITAIPVWKWLCQS